MMLLIIQEKTREMIFFMENNATQEFEGEIDEDFDDNFDDIDRYINTKLSFLNDDTLLGWWNKHSLIFSQLSVLAKSIQDIHNEHASIEETFKDGVLPNNRG